MITCDVEIPTLIVLLYKIDYFYSSNCHLSLIDTPTKYTTWCTVIYIYIITKSNI